MVISLNVPKILKKCQSTEDTKWNNHLVPTWLIHVKVYIFKYIDFIFTIYYNKLEKPSKIKNKFEKYK